MELQKFEISDSKLEHNDWRFPSTLKTRPLLPVEEEDFLVNHKIDRSYDDSTTRLKLVVGNATSANLKDSAKLPVAPDVLQTIRRQRWVSDEYEHLWSRDSGGSAALRSHGILSVLSLGLAPLAAVLTFVAAFLLQTPRDGKSFCSLSLVNRERDHCGGLFIADERYNLSTLLGGQIYQNRHPKVPRDFSILPLLILARHVDDTLTQVQRLSRDVVSIEKRIADGDIKLEDNVDYKTLNRLSLEHLRLLRRSNFEIELAKNLGVYLQDYLQMWHALWEGGTSFVDEMQEKVHQQIRYAEQVKIDLEMIPRRIKNQSKAIFSFIAQRDNKLNIQLAESSRKIAEETRRDNLLNLEIAAANVQVAEEMRSDSLAMRSIAILTLTFLPGTFVASFFSMNGLFEWPSPAEGSYASPMLWVFFVVTIPLTLIVYLLWTMWFKYSQARFKQQHIEAVTNLEKELKNRVRSATGTW